MHAIAARRLSGRENMPRCSRLGILWSGLSFEPVWQYFLDKQVEVLYQPPSTLLSDTTEALQRDIHASDAARVEECEPNWRSSDAEAKLKECYREHKIELSTGMLPFSVGGLVLDLDEKLPDVCDGPEGERCAISLTSYCLRGRESPRISIFPISHGRSH